jgi:hypothetical protein
MLRMLGSTCALDTEAEMPYLHVHTHATYTNIHAYTHKFVDHILRMHSCLRCKDI